MARLARLGWRETRVVASSGAARGAAPCATAIGRNEFSAPTFSKRQHTDATATSPWSSTRGVTHGFAADTRTHNNKALGRRHFASGLAKGGDETDDDDEDEDETDDESEDDDDDDDDDGDDDDSDDLDVAGVLPRRETLPETQGSMLDVVNVPVYTISGEKTGEFVTLPGRIFDVPLRVDVAQRVVVWQRNKKRRGLHKTKTRAQVKGTTRKARPQKGSGRARVGDLRAPQMRGGGVAHGPVVRSHATKLQRKVRKLGLKIALSAKAAEGRVVVIDNCHEGVLSPKTKWLDSALDKLLGVGALAAGERQHSVLCAELPPTEDTPGALKGKRRDPVSSDMVDCLESNGKRASKNLPHVHVMHQKGLNVYDVLRYRSLAITKGALAELIARIDAPVKR